MTNQSETVGYEKAGFDGQKYIELQKSQILERVSKFSGRLYLEVGGKLMYDAHASRVLPGFDPLSKKIIFSSLKDHADMLFCCAAEDIIEDRQLSNENIKYIDSIQNMLKAIEEGTGIRPQLVISKIKKLDAKLKAFIAKFEKLGYHVWKRIYVEDYKDPDVVLSKDGYGKSEHIIVKKNLVLVTGAASSSGKMATCMGQIYLDDLEGIRSGYAKYETFPIWNLPLEHPVNLAYEAATADIGDANCIDPYHKKAYKQDAVNYNRDIENFEIVMGISKKIVSHKNYMRKYKSPTDMGINCAGFAITDDKIVSLASLEEIRRRKSRYQEVVDRKEGKQERIERCNQIEKTCIEYCERKGYL